MISSPGKRGLFTALVGVALLLWVPAGLTAQTSEDLYSEQGYEMEGSEEIGAIIPSFCPPYITSAGMVQGEYFVGVRHVKRSGFSNHGYYENLDEYVRSYNRQWLWWNGGGNFTCHAQKVLPGFYIEYQLLVPPSDGVLLPNSEEDDGGGSAGGGDGGGEEDGGGEGGDESGGEPVDDGGDPVEEGGDTQTVCYENFYYDEYWNLVAYEYYCREERMS